MSAEFLPDPQAVQRSADFEIVEEVDSRRYDEIYHRLSNEVERFGNYLLQLVSTIGLRFSYRRWIDATLQLVPKDREPASFKNAPPEWKEVRLVVERRKGDWTAFLVVRAASSEYRAPLEVVSENTEYEEQIYYFEQSGLEQLIIWSQLASPFLSAYRATVARAIQLATQAAERLQMINSELVTQLG